jgi:hypothetical protein
VSLATSPSSQELKKIGALAESLPHEACASYVSTVASLHVDATTPSAAIQEYTLARIEQD